MTRRPWFREGADSIRAWWPSESQTGARARGVGRTGERVKTVGDDFAGTEVAQGWVAKEML